MLFITNLIKALFKFLFKKSINKNSTKFKNLKNIHQGENCFIFGDGNSIKNYDLKNFSRNKSFIIKYLFIHKQFKLLNFKYSTSIEPFFFNFFLLSISRFFRRKLFRKNIINNFLFRYLISKSYKKLILENKKASFFVSFYNFSFLKNENIYNVADNTNLILNNFFKLSKNQFDFNKNSTRLALSIASYMGFKKIYLIGFDYLENNKISGHWYESYSKRDLKKNTFDQLFIKKINQKNKSKLIIINKSGKNYLLPCISYKNFCKKNHISINKRNMVKTHYLKMFKLTNQYNI
tara:strand:- start:99 stop:974 length:876 start_codon:yes stop_codon:yes gene_type:complete